ncbi:glycoside hydrolase family 37 protein [Moniliophthora roreri MCA 2997]|uniref:Trehalase n=1 Tax=Moniliophthora roreri (strain MCA 2997) TaxID=1381753 RepID=V2XZG9_MONRO|nr:glycoside hydrolase family 37 protein [Moniliophthora roreri MCA 2997]
MLTVFTIVACLLHTTLAQIPTTNASVSQIPVSTVVASPSAAPTSLLPSQVPLPPRQSWCPSEIFCAGPLLQSVNLANLFPDQKTFVDKPTVNSTNVTLQAFQSLGSNATVEQYQNFVNAFFKGEGLELEGLILPNFNPNPPFLANVSDSLVKAFSQTVHSFWTQLIRGTNSSSLCNGIQCESSLIPLNHTFVVPGGRFREQYYWDSFWIVEGLLESQLFDIVNATLQNFMDELDNFGFIPNGGRIYYLDRSQPPLFIQMLARYMAVTNDRDILTRALPLAEREMQWWQINRTLNVTSPFSNRTFAMTRYAVNNSAPRPESYLTDYLTANGPNVSFNETQRAGIYAELATAAETGWDYTARWLSNFTAHSADLTTLRIRDTIPVDLNSILYRNHLLLADLYDSVGSNSSTAESHRSRAASLREGIIDLFWDSEKAAFYDFNFQTNARNNFFSVVTFYPMWSGIIPDDILRSPERAFAAFSSVNMLLNRYNGSFPTTFVDTGLQWDAPNAWPPHQYVVLQALRNLPSNITSNPLPTPSSNQSTFNLIPVGQLGLEESQLPGQQITTSTNASATGAASDINKLNGTVFNGGNATSGEGWAHALQRELANRYIASVLCSWRATGGSIPGVLPRYSDAELNVTQSVGQNGNMFEKFSNLDIGSAGRGGEYTVQAGFGWTNGVLLWAASVYGDVLVAPQCPSLLESGGVQNGNGSESSGGGNGESGGGGNGSGSGSNSAARLSVSSNLGLLGILLALLAL